MIKSRVDSIEKASNLIGLKMVFNCSTASIGEWTKTWTRDSIEIELLKTFSTRKKGGMVPSIEEEGDEIDISTREKGDDIDLSTWEEVDNTDLSTWEETIKL